MARSTGYETAVLSALDKIERIQQKQSETTENLYLDVGKNIVSGQVEVISELKSQTTLLGEINDNLKKGKSTTTVGESSGVLGPAKDMVMQMAGVMIALGGAFLIFGNGLINVGNIDTKAALTFSVVMLAIFSSISAIFRDGIIISIKQAIKLAAVSTILAFSIEMVAQIFSRIPNVSVAQLGTAIAIAAALVPVVTHISEAMTSLFGSGIMGVLGGIVKGALTTVATLGAMIILPMMAMSVTLSAGILSSIQPVSMKQIMTMVLISAAMIPMVYNFVKIMEALRGPTGMQRLMETFSGKVGGVSFGGFGGGMSTKDAAMGALILLPVIAFAMVIISYIFNQLPPPKYTVGSIVLLGLAAVAMIPMVISFAIATQALRYMTSVKGVLIAGAVLPIIAASMVAVALIFKFLPKVFNNPDVKWAILTGAALASFAIPLRIVAGTFKNLKGKDLAQMVTVALLILPAIAASIVAVAYIFQMMPAGAVAPDWKWTLKAGFAMMMFGTPFVAMTLILRGLKLKDLLHGALGQAIVAGAIVGVAMVFQYLPEQLRAPDAAWTLKAGLSMMAFGIPFTFMTIMLKALTTKDLLHGALGQAIVAGAIVGVAWVFQFLPKQMQAPPLMWTIRAAASLFAFAIPFVGMTLLFKVFGGGAITSMLLGAAGLSILALAIVGVAWVFQLLPKEFKIIPLSWSVGLAAASMSFVIIAFAIGAIGALVSLFTPVGFGLGVLGILLIGAAIVGLAWLFKLLPADIFEPGGLLYNVADTMTYFAFKMVDIFVYLVAKLLPIIQEFIQFMTSDVIVGGLSKIVMTIAAFATKLIEATIPLVEAFLPYFQSFIDGFVEVLKIGGNIITTIIEEIGDIIKTAISSFASGVDAIGNFLLKMKEIGAVDLLAIGGALVVVAGGIGAVMLALAGGNIMNAVSGMVSSVASAIGGGLQKLVGIEPEPQADDPVEVVMAVASAVEKIAKFEKPIDRIAKSFTKIAKEMGTFKDNFNGLDGDRLESVNSMLFNAKEMAENNASVMNAVASGIQSGIANVGKTVAGFFSDNKEKSESGTTAAISAQNQQLGQQMVQMNQLLTQLLSTMNSMNQKLDSEIQVKVTDSDYGLGT